MPEQTSRLHEHKDFARLGPRSGKKMCVIGRKLVPGDVIEETDFYESAAGEWLPAPTGGATLQEGVEVVYVRPD